MAPKRAALAEANKKLEAANKKLSGIRAEVKRLQDRVALLEQSLMKATEDKNAAMAQAERTARKAQIAERLINGLSGENTRWGAEIKRLEVLEGKLVGDVLIASAFVSYAGPFNMQFRQSLVNEKWLPDLIERQIPMTQGIKPLDLLTDDATKAKWANEGLPTDPLSVENGAIMSNASRWALMIDPQLQGIKWIINKEQANGLVIIQQSQPKYIDQVRARCPASCGCGCAATDHLVLPSRPATCLHSAVADWRCSRSRSAVAVLGKGQRLTHCRAAAGDQLHRERLAAAD